MPRPGVTINAATLVPPSSITTSHTLIAQATPLGQGRVHVEVNGHRYVASDVKLHQDTAGNVLVQVELPGVTVMDAMANTDLGYGELRKSCKAKTKSAVPPWSPIKALEP
jgi:hypothetical protein